MQDLIIFSNSKHSTAVVKSVDYISIIKMSLLCVMIFKMNKSGLKNSCYLFSELRCAEFKCFEYISVHSLLITQQVPVIVLIQYAIATGLKTYTMHLHSPDPLT